MGTKIDSKGNVDISGVSELNLPEGKRPSKRTKTESAPAPAAKPKRKTTKAFDLSAVAPAKPKIVESPLPKAEPAKKPEPAKKAAEPPKPEKVVKEKPTPAVVPEPAPAPVQEAKKPEPAPVKEPEPEPKKEPEPVKAEPVNSMNLDSIGEAKKNEEPAPSKDIDVKPMEEKPVEIKPAETPKEGIKDLEFKTAATERVSVFKIVPVEDLEKAAVNYLPQSRPKLSSVISDIQKAAKRRLSTASSAISIIGKHGIYMQAVFNVSGEYVYVVSAGEYMTAFGLKNNDVVDCHKRLKFKAGFIEYQGLTKAPDFFTK